MNLSRENMDRIRVLVENGLALTPEDARDLQGHNDHLMGLAATQSRIILRTEEELRFIRQNWFEYNPCTKTLTSKVRVSCDSFNDALARGRAKEFNISRRHDEQEQPK